MRVLRFIYWPPLAYARWVQRESDFQKRERGRFPSDSAYYRIAFCILWTAVIVLAIATAVVLAG